MSPPDAGLAIGVGPPRRQLRLRGRLLLAFVLVGVPPLIALALAFHFLVSQRLDESALDRLKQALETTRQELDRMGRQAERKVAAVVTEDLPQVAPDAESDPRLASRLAARRDLEALEVVDLQDRVLSSHHWSAGYGLPDSDQVFFPEPTVRVERAAEGFGVRQRLALMPSRAGVLRGREVTVRGGSFIDAEFLERLSTLAGTPVAFYDGRRRAWIAPSAAATHAWEGPSFGHGRTTGVVSLGGVRHQWIAAPFRPWLWLVVTVPRTEMEAVTARLRAVTLLAAALALVGSVLAGLVLSARIVRPVHELAQAALRVAEGELPDDIAVAAVGEVGDLAQAFNRMTRELRSSRAQLIQAERVAAWREMARRLAHELKNPLFPIQLSIETLKRAFDRAAAEPASPENARNGGFAALFRDSTHTILQELGSLRKIIEEFSEFARLPRPQLRPASVNHVVAQVLSLYQARLGETRIEVSLDPAIPLARLDPQLLGRAVGNLLANALEAMGGTGTLTVRTSFRSGLVAVAVGDTGPGLGDEQKARLFSPYFTTKQGGTGLGLAIVQSVLSDHGGRVEVRSEPGEGATFTLVLPAADAENRSVRS